MVSEARTTPLSGRERASRTIPRMHPLPSRVREFYRGSCMWVRPGFAKRRTERRRACPERSRRVRHRNFCARFAAFRPNKSKPDLLGSSCARVCDARKGDFQDALQPDFAALDSLRSSRAKRSSQALTLVSWAETGKGCCVESHSFRKRRGQDGRLALIPGRERRNVPPVSGFPAATNLKT